MTFAERITQARHDRDARRAARTQFRKLTDELAAYSSPSERAEIELLAGRSTAPDAEIVRTVLDQLRVTDTVIRTRQTV